MDMRSSGFIHINLEIRDFALFDIYIGNYIFPNLISRCSYLRFEALNGTLPISIV